MKPYPLRRPPRAPELLLAAALYAGVLTVSALAPTPSEAAVFVHRGPVRTVVVAPPPPPVIATPPHRAGWVWAPPYWRWTGVDYVWESGLWLRARPGRVYVPAHWTRHRDAWIFAPGVWVAAR